ncbi:MAG: hypothetical protein COS95_03510 [Ignavibacteriales bacterium CG07_land_8_20_14_0_80_59_12]|nr:MAG: hypothetical protein COS95_03510 [Ignavibacteriales bacterium CG07_land_8_20_14_0_80_59_12]
MKLQPIVLILIAALFSLTVGACTLAKLTGRGPVPILLNNPRAKVDVIKHIRDSKMVVFDYTGVFDASEILSKHFEETKADAIINVTFAIKSDVGSFFVNLITLGIANARVMEVEGDLIKAPQGLGLLDIRGSETIAIAETIEELITKASDSASLNAAPQMIVRSENGFKLVRYNQAALLEE